MRQWTSVHFVLSKFSYITLIFFFIFSNSITESEFLRNRTLTLHYGIVGIGLSFETFKLNI